MPAGRGRRRRRKTPLLRASGGKRRGWHRHPGQGSLLSPVPLHPHDPGVPGGELARGKSQRGAWRGAGGGPEEARRGRRLQRARKRLGRRIAAAHEFPFGAFTLFHLRAPPGSLPVSTAQATEPAAAAQRQPEGRATRGIKKTSARADGTDGAPGASANNPAFRILKAMQYITSDPSPHHPPPSPAPSPPGSRPLEGSFLDL